MYCIIRSGHMKYISLFWVYRVLRLARLESGKLFCTCVHQKGSESGAPNGAGTTCQELQLDGVLAVAAQQMNLVPEKVPVVGKRLLIIAVFCNKSISLSGPRLTYSSAPGREPRLVSADIQTKHTCTLMFCIMLDRNSNTFPEIPTNDC